MMSRTQSQQEKSNTTKYTTLKETPFAVSGSANVAVRTTHWEEKDRSGVYVQVRKSQLKGKGKPAEFSSVTLGNDPDVIEQIGKALVAHAQALRAKK